MSTTPRLSHRRRGFSLIELLVSMAIGLVLTIAITSVMIRSEGSKRSTASVNDISQSGAYAAYVLDRAIRSAGSGYSQKWTETYGCRLDVSFDNRPVLPLPAALAATTSAFKNLPQDIRLAPVVIAKDFANVVGPPAETRGDVLLVMSGTGGVGELPQAVNAGGVSASQLSMQNTLGFATDDLVLLTDPGVAGGCMLQQVGTRAATDYGATLPLAGRYYKGTGTNVGLSSFGTSTSVMQLGRYDQNMPQFQAYGVGANRTLMAFDLLERLPSTNVPDKAVADGVVEMRALYGIDSDADGRVDTWIDPVAGSGWSAAELTDGSATARGRLRQIAAIKLGLILRTSLKERSSTNVGTGALAVESFQNATGTTLTLFTDLPSALQYTRTLTTDELGYRFRTVEVAIPVRNAMLAPT